MGRADEDHGKLADTGSARSVEDMLMRMHGLRAACREVAEPVRVAGGRMIFGKGDDADCLYLLDEGSVEISVFSHDGRKLLLEVMHAPAIFGEIGLFAGARMADATALSDARLLCVRRTDLVARLRGEPDLLLDVIELLCGRLRIISARLEDRIFLPLHVRVARRILSLLDQAAEGDGTVDLSQAELANFVGATREGVAKVLAPWRQLGWVTISRGSLRVRDRAALETVATSSGP